MQPSNTPGLTPSQGISLSPSVTFSAKSAAKPFLTQRFEEALLFATRLHAKQIRKGGDNIPYVSHLLGVTSIVLENGGTEDEAIAAMLHDAVEDQGGEATRQIIRAMFGENVTRIVDECTDTDVSPKPPWCERKEAYIRHVGTISPSGLLVSMSDKLYNLRSIKDDYAVVGDAVWDRFAGGKEGSLWYYETLIKAYEKRSPSHSLVGQLKRTWNEFSALQAQPKSS